MFCEGEVGKVCAFLEGGLSAPPWMNDTFTEGYVLPLLSEPHVIHSPTSSQLS